MIHSEIYPLKAVTFHHFMAALTQDIYAAQEVRDAAMVEKGAMLERERVAQADAAMVEKGAMLERERVAQADAAMVEKGAMLERECVAQADAAMVEKGAMLERERVAQADAMFSRQVRVHCLAPFTGIDYISVFHTSLFG